ncbi:ABC transporter B family member 16, partial [Mucuna pruriens]
MRIKYLKAVLRQDVAYFDLHETSTSEVITCVSSDSLVRWELHVGFALFWRLTIVRFPFVVLLVIPRLIYGKTMMGLARKIREESNKAGTIAEQAISSIRTVYSFVGESKTIDAFSDALKGRWKQWCCVCYMGLHVLLWKIGHPSTMVLRQGLALGASLSDLKYFTEACAAGERIMEMIKRVPKIDSENMAGEILEKIPAGKTVALVGGSGSGKSTVMSLLQRFYDPIEGEIHHMQRFYDPIEGEIHLDDVAIHRLLLKWLRSQVGLVSQDPTLFATSIKENILFGRDF